MYEASGLQVSMGTQNTFPQSSEIHPIQLDRLFPLRPPEVYNEYRPGQTSKLDLSYVVHAEHALHLILNSDLMSVTVSLIYAKFIGIGYTFLADKMNDNQYTRNTFCGTRC